MQNRVRFLLSVRCMLLGNSLEPRSNSRVPNSTAGPVMIICLSINGRLQSKNQFNEINQDWLVQKFGFKGWHNSSRYYFPPCRSRKRNREALPAVQSAGFPFLHNSVIKMALFFIFSFTCFHVCMISSWMIERLDRKLMPRGLISYRRLVRCFVLRDGFGWFRHGGNCDQTMAKMWRKPVEM